jgi:hypothetical protein
MQVEAEYERERTVVRALELTIAEAALVCEIFRSRKLASVGGYAWMGRDLLDYADSHGREWRVDAHALANRLTLMDSSQRSALEGAARRFWNRYHRDGPSAAMRDAGFLR